MSEAGRLRALAAASSAERWSLPAVEGTIVGGRRNFGGAGEDAGDRALQAERERGYEAGMAAGRAEMQRLTGELQMRVRRLDSALALLARPLAELDDEVQQQLLLLALAIGKQLARREIKASPEEIIAVIRESVGRLPASAREVRVHLHPGDAAVVREHLSAPAAERAWTLVEDPTQSRGGCLVRTETSQIDQRLETRVNAVVASLMGDERAGPRVARSDGPLAEQGGSPDAGQGADRDGSPRADASGDQGGGPLVGQGEGHDGDPGAGPGGDQDGGARVGEGEGEGEGEGPDRRPDPSVAADPSAAGDTGT